MSVIPDGFFSFLFVFEGGGAVSRCFGEIVERQRCGEAIKVVEGLLHYRSPSQCLE